jgi:PelA/Pel-15E family pectate lyase
MRPRGLVAVLALASLAMLPPTAVGADTGGDDRLVAQAVAAMQRATAFFHGRVAVRGGYVWECSANLQSRRGERKAGATEIWVQPPGTPTVGMAFLDAHAATGDASHLLAARDAARALLHGQLASGGWTDSIDFDPQSRTADRYRNGQGRAKGQNYSTLDDDKTQSALRFLMRLDERLGFEDADLHEGVMVALDAVLAAQFPSGGYPQGWRAPVDQHPVLRASYPDYDWRTDGRVKDYWDLPTLNDGLAGSVARTLHMAHGTYHDDRFRRALERLGEFLLLAQMPEPQPAWAQQYTFDMHPAWARKFEPPAVAGSESEDVVETLVFLYGITGDRRLLDAAAPALAWMRRSLLPDGRLARFYELRTNRPLYLTRDTYELTHDDDRLPTHYSFAKRPRLETLERQLAAARAGTNTTETAPSLETLRRDAERIIKALDDEGRWLATDDGKPWPTGRAVTPQDGGDAVISSTLFSRNLSRLAAFVTAARAAAASVVPGSAQPTEVRPQAIRAARMEPQDADQITGRVERRDVFSR